MNIVVDESASTWLKEEFGVATGGAVRIMTRYGDSPVQPGFALTLSVESPRDVASLVEQDGIRIFVKQQDTWYFNGGNVHMHYDKASDELTFDVS